MLAAPVEAQWRRPPAVPLLVGADPASPADIVGRDLDLFGLGHVGHVGIWTGEHVIEALNIGGNAININSLADFKSRTRYWGAAFLAGLENLAPQRMCTDAACSYVITLNMRDAVVHNASLIQKIGADYTIADGYISARPACLPPACSRFRHPVRGLYRCDKFVIDRSNGQDSGLNSCVGSSLSCWHWVSFSRISAGPIEPGVPAATHQDQN